METAEIKRVDLETEEDRQERYRLRQLQKDVEEQRHQRWALHNRTNMNRRPCPCDKPECKRARAGRR